MEQDTLISENTPVENEQEAQATESTESAEGAESTQEAQDDQHTEGQGTSEESQSAQDNQDDDNGQAAQGVQSDQTQKTQENFKAPEPIADPGEFKPNDYSFDIKLADGTVINIQKPEDMSKVPQDADFGTPKEFLDVQAKYSRMVNGIESDKQSYEQSKQKFNEQEEDNKRREEYTQTSLREIDYLIAKGILPKIPPQYLSADWSDPEVAKQPGVKETNDLIMFRNEENKLRYKAGLSPISILDAQTAMENKAFKEAAAQREQKENDLRKKRSGMIAGQSATSSAVSGDSDMIVGAGGSLRDLGY